MKKKNSLILFCVFYSACSQSQPDVKEVNKDNCHVAAKIFSEEIEKLRQGSARCEWLLDSVIKLCPANADYWYEKGVAYAKRGDFATWSFYIDKAVGIFPYYYLGLRGWYTWKFLKDYHAAYADFLQSELINSSSVYSAADFLITTWLGICHLEFKHNDSALYYFNKSIDSTILKRGPQHVGLYDYLFRAITKIRLEKYEEALVDLDIQNRKTEKNADGYYYKGLVLMKMNKKEEALNNLKKAFDLFTKDGYHQNDPYCEMPFEIYLSDISKAIHAASK